MEVDGFERGITASEMERIVSGLEADDLLVPNMVHNIAVFRNNEYIGFINCRTGAVELSA
jgi:hypothetical protein